MSPRVVGHHRLLRELGRGGMGVVYEAEHETLGQRAAVKLVRPELAMRPDVATRFLREARAGAALRSDRVAKVFDAGVLDDGTPYFVMELLRGEALSERLQKRGALGVTDAVSFVIEACEPLAEAHARGMVHRDVKPSNLFVATTHDQKQRLMVLDFGVAKAALGDGHDTLTDPSAVVGSPRYMAPEQLRDPHGVDARADVWALGVVLYELLSAKSPFAGDGAGAVLAAIAADTPPRLEGVAPAGAVPTALADVVHACLDKDRGRRPKSAAALAIALAAFANPDAATLARELGARSAALETAETWDPVSDARAAVPREETPEAVGGTRQAPRSGRWIAPVIGASALGAAAFVIFALPTREPTRTTPPPPASEPAIPASAAPSASDVEPVASTAPSASAAPSASVSAAPVPVAARPAPVKGPSEAVLKRRRQEEELRARRPK